jgi:hypothetical protein
MQLYPYPQNPGNFHYLTGQLSSTGMEQEGSDIDRLTDMVRGSEAQLNAARDAYYPLRQTRDNLKIDVKGLYSRLKSMAKESRLLKNITKITPFTGMGFFPVMMAGASVTCPLAIVIGGIVTFGSVAIHEYCIRLDKAIDTAFQPLEEQYERAAAGLNQLESQCTCIEERLSLLDMECRELKERLARAEVIAMADTLTAGTAQGSSEVEDDGEFIVIGDMKIEKKAA